MNRSAKVAVVALVVALAAALAFVLGGGAAGVEPDARAEATAGEAPPSTVPEPVAAPGTASDHQPRVEPPAEDAERRRARARARRDALLEAIAETLDRKRRGGAYPGPQVEEGEIDEAYLQERLREDLIPEARGCYNQVLVRDGAYEGTIALDFTIVADEELGGVVERVELADGTSIDDPTMLECMEQATYGLVFEPPKAGGRVRLSYQMVFEPGE